MTLLLLSSSVLALVLALVFLIRLWFPHLWADLRYSVVVLGIAFRVGRFLRRRPFFTVLDRFLEQVRLQPEKVFLVFEGQSFSYREADRQSNRVARALRAQAGLLEGHTVALFVGNQPEFLWLWLGLSKLGCSAALLNTNVRATSLLHSLDCSSSKVLLTTPDLLEPVVEVLPELRSRGVRVFVLGKDPGVEGIESLSDQDARDEPLSADLRANVSSHSPALYIYTSGTTGLPKAAGVSQLKMWYSSYVQSFAGVTSDDVLYLYLPLYHSAGFLMGLAGAIDRGLTVVLRRKFSASQFWDDCRRYNVTVIQYIGEVMRYLCNAPKRDNDKDHKVRVAMGNGIRPDTWADFLHRFGNIQVCECYGSTEGNIGFINYTGKIGAIGRQHILHRMAHPYALIGYDTEKEEPVRDLRGFCVQVSTGEVGLLVGKIGRRSPFDGYAKNRQQTEKKILKDVFVKGDRYFNSGDLLRLDAEGFVYFQDRIGDTFRWKGENVATTEVSDHLLNVDCVEEANVYGVKVPGHEGRIGMAALKLRGNMDFDSSATHEHVKTFLPSYARPRFIRIQAALDLTATYKQTKVKLAEEGFDPSIIKDPLYFLDDTRGYVPMTHDLFDSIAEGKLRL